MSSEATKHPIAQGGGGGILGFHTSFHVLLIIMVDKTKGCRWLIIIVHWHTIASSLEMRQLHASSHISAVKWVWSCKSGHG